MGRKGLSLRAPNGLFVCANCERGLGRSKRQNVETSKRQNSRQRPWRPFRRFPLDVSPFGRLDVSMFRCFDVWTFQHGLWTFGRFAVSLIWGQNPDLRALEGILLAESPQK